jgi:uncharacterized damage-inducible protein DinB
MRRFKINEELSVSSTVTEMCKELSYQLINKLKKSKKKVVQNKSYLMYNGQLTFDCSEFLKTINFLKVIYVVYLYNNENECHFAENSGQMNCSADYENKNIKLALGYVNGKPSRNFFASIAHELKHIYEYDRGMQKNTAFYDRVVDRYKNGTQWEKIVAQALYMSFKTEQDAFLSQFYAYLSSDSFYENDPMKDKENPYYQFDRAFDAVDNLNFSEEQLKQSFGLTINQLYHILESADERLYKKMCHVWQKHHYDSTRNSINLKQGEFMLECFKNGIEDVESDIVW